MVVRYLGGWLADRLDRPKQVALTGYDVVGAGPDGPAVDRPGLPCRRRARGRPPRQGPAHRPPGRPHRRLERPGLAGPVVRGAPRPGHHRRHARAAARLRRAVGGPRRLPAGVRDLPGGGGHRGRLLALLVPDLRPASSDAARRGDETVALPGPSVAAARRARVRPPRGGGRPARPADPQRRASSTWCCRTATTWLRCGSRCCSSAPTSPTSPWPCPSDGSPTGSAGPG